MNDTAKTDGESLREIDKVTDSCENKKYYRISGDFDHHFKNALCIVREMSKCHTTFDVFNPETGLLWLGYEISRELLADVLEQSVSEDELMELIHAAKHRLDVFCGLR